ncbi:hypothetical protein ES703_72870 [subsurface metagenome]
MTITDQKLEEAITLHNTTRERIQRLYEMRKKDAPPITGEEALTITIAAHLMPRDQFNTIMDDLLADLTDVEGARGYRARVIITGSELDNPEYIAGIEQQGALSVADTLPGGIVQGDGLFQLFLRYGQPEMSFYLCLEPLQFTEIPTEESFFRSPGDGKHAVKRQFHFFDEEVTSATNMVTVLQQDHTIKEVEFFPQC